MCIRAIIFGIITTITLLLSSQLAFVLLASYISSAATEHAFINANKELLWFTLGAGTYCISFALGGMATALLADKNKIKHAAIVGFLVAAASILTTGDLSILNYKAVLLLIAGLAFAALGGMAFSGPAKYAKTEKTGNSA